MLPSGHRPHSVALVQEGFTPLDDLPIQRPLHLFVQRAVAPAHQGHIPADCAGIVLLLDFWVDTSSHRTDLGAVRCTIDQRFDRLVRRRRDAFEQVSPENLEVADFLSRDLQLVVSCEGSNGRIQVLRRDPAGLHELSILFVRQIASASGEAPANANCLLETKCHQVMKRVVVDKASHRPIVGDDLARAVDQLVEFLESFGHHDTPPWI